MHLYPTNTTCHKWGFLWHGAILMRWLWGHEDAHMALACHGCSIWTLGRKITFVSVYNWQHFTALYCKDGFLIKSRNTQPYWSNTRDVCASAFKGAVLDSWHARVWENRLTWCTPDSLYKIAGCLCSYFTVNLIVSVPEPFSQELLWRWTQNAPHPQQWWCCGLGSHGFLLDIWMWWSSATWVILRVECAQFQGQALSISDFLPAKNKHMKLLSCKWTFSSAAPLFPLFSVPCTPFCHTLGLPMLPFLQSKGRWKQVYKTQYHMPWPMWGQLRDHPTWIPCH